MLPSHTIIDEMTTSRRPHTTQCVFSVAGAASACNGGAVWHRALLHLLEEVLLGGPPPGAGGDEVFVPRYGGKEEVVSGV